MRIGGFLKQSLIDWEGMIAAVIFTKGCNFRCGFCHNPSLVLPELFDASEDIEIDEIVSYLDTRRQWIDGVVISGGEPTIHPDLPDLIKVIRQQGFKIKLDTNGTNPSMIRRLIDEMLIDYVAMDIKTKIEFKEYNTITGSNIPGVIERISESIDTLRMSDIQYQFRTTVIPGFHTEEILALLKGKFADDNYKLQPFRQGTTIDFYNVMTK